MNLLRQRHVGYWLALFAMALQLTFSFGHVHGEQFHVNGKIISAAEALFAHSAHDHTVDHSTHNHPSGGRVHIDLYYADHSDKDHQDHQDHQEDDNCPTCWTLTAAGSLVLPVIAVLPRYFRNCYTCRISAHTSLVSSLLAQPYQSRAPPFGSIV